MLRGRGLSYAMAYKIDVRALWYRCARLFYVDSCSDPGCYLHLYRLGYPVSLFLSARCMVYLAVSYTHLDVYKRQHQWKSKSPCFSQHFPLQKSRLFQQITVGAIFFSVHLNRSIRKQRYRLVASVLFGDAEALFLHTIAVDVYKRQDAPKAC